MSSHDRQLVLSPQAEADLTNILQYALETWGENLMARYAELLDDGQQLIRANPPAGIAQPRVSAGDRFFPR